MRKSGHRPRHFAGAVVWRPYGRHDYDLRLGETACWAISGRFRDPRSFSAAQAI